MSIELLRVRKIHSFLHSCLSLLSVSGLTASPFSKSCFKKSHASSLRSTRELNDIPTNAHWCSLTN